MYICLDSSRELVTCPQNRWYDFKTSINPVLSLKRGWGWSIRLIRLDLETEKLHVLSGIERLKPHQKHDPITESKYIFVYCDCSTIDNDNYASTSNGLLCYEYRGGKKTRFHIKPNHPMFQPIIREDIPSLRIYIRDEHGKIPPFNINNTRCILEIEKQDGFGPPWYKV